MADNDDVAALHADRHDPDAWDNREVAVTVTPARDCPDCGVPPGVPHGDGCDVARCLWTGGQRIQCVGGMMAEVVRTLRECRCADNHRLAEDLAFHVGLDDPDHDCGEQVWTGRWPGDEDCERFGLWCVWGPDVGLRGWVPVRPGTDGATYDLNRLSEVARWDRTTQRWELR